VIERHACDIAPIDLEDSAQRLRLRAYIWADQRERLSGESFYRAVHAAYPNA